MSVLCLSPVSVRSSVILAGGTMQPVSEFRDQLFLAAGAEPGRVTVFSCGHVVPPDQLLTLSLAAGPSGGPLCFNFQNRALPDTVSCRCLLLEQGAASYP